MIIQYLSDLHLDFFHSDMGLSWVNTICRNKSADVLIVAGDMSEIVKRDGTVGGFHRRNIEILCKTFQHVIEVPGNHTYYGTSPAVVADYMSVLLAEISGYHALDCTSIDIDGVTIAGATMWFRDDPLNVCYRSQMNDFRLIQGFVPWVYETNKKSVDFIRHCGADVMVTHHLPGYQLIDDCFRGNPLNRFYVCDMLHEDFRKRPAVWIHGHSHSTMDVVIGNTRHVRNPLGYRGENKQFNVKATIEI